MHFLIIEISFIKTRVFTTNGHIDPHNEQLLVCLITQLVDVASQWSRFESHLGLIFWGLSFDTAQVA